MVITREITEEIKSSVNSAIGKCFADPDLIKSIADNVSDAVMISVNKKIADLEHKLIKHEDDMLKKIADTNSKVDILNELINKITNENSKLVEKYDVMEQEAKRNKLRIFNFKERDGENVVQDVVSFVWAKMVLNISASDVQKCFRIGKRVDGKTRSIFLQLKFYDMRQEIFGKKRLLKGSDIVVKEDLTSVRLEIVRNAINKFSSRNVWTENGKRSIRKHLDEFLVYLDAVKENIDVIILSETWNLEMFDIDLPLGMMKIVKKIGGYFQYTESDDVIDSIEAKSDSAIIFVLIFQEGDNSIDSCYLC